MASLNQCNFIGNVGRDPEIKSFDNGGKIANLSIACSEKWKDRTSGEAKERTEWVNLSIKAEGLVSVVERFVTKGSRIYITGKLQTRKWQDQSGSDRYSTEVVLQGPDARIILLDGKPGGNASDGSEQQSSQTAALDTNLDDDVPF